MINAFVVPTVDRLPLAGTGGHWVDVKHELTYGEHQAMYAQMRKQFAHGEPPVLDPTLIGAARMNAFIVGWSFVDASGPVPVSRGAIDNLREPMADAIRAALDDHIEQLEREQAAEKNDRDGAIDSSPITPSVS